MLLLDTGGGFEVVAGLQRADDLAGRGDPDLPQPPPLRPPAGPGAPLAAHRPAGDVVGSPRRPPSTSTGPRRCSTPPAPSWTWWPRTPSQFIEDGGGRVAWGTCDAGRSVELWPDAHLTPFLADHIPDDGTNLGCAVDLRPAGAPRGGAPGLQRGLPSARPPCVRPPAEADVLIHEAGGLDAQQQQVALAGHSTAGEAARQARAGRREPASSCTTSRTTPACRRCWPRPAGTSRAGLRPPGWRVLSPAGAGLPAPPAPPLRPAAPAELPQSVACGVTASAESPPAPPPGA